jgi:cysteinyl-tRNA synthetase
MTTLRLHNTLARAKQDFAPIDPNHVTMYVCGPTVYDFAHIGNARPVIVFDVLFRLLRHLYGEDRVTYVRNITDVDDKINARALRDFGSEIEAGTMSLNDAIRQVTEKTADQYHADMDGAGRLRPDRGAARHRAHRPDDRHDRDPDRQGPCLCGRGARAVRRALPCRITAKLSRRDPDEQIAGARSRSRPTRRPGRFRALEALADDGPGWDSPWGRGPAGLAHRMLGHGEAHLGEVFDIHGGGLDLIFPHHENEIAQSCCAHGTDRMANYWLHNGFCRWRARRCPSRRATSTRSTTWLKEMGARLGLLQTDPDAWFQDAGGAAADGPAAEQIEALIAERTAARKAKDFARSDEIRDTLKAQGVILEDGPGGTTWKRA